MLLDASHVQAERNPFLSLPVALGAPIFPRAVAMTASNFMRHRDPCHERVAEAGLVLTGDIYPPVAVPTIPLPFPSSPLASPFPANWVKIPQRSYDYGCKQLDFDRLEPIPFGANGHPGINLGDALRKNCARLNRRDDPVLQGTSGVISCRLLVGSLHFFFWLERQG